MQIEVIDQLGVSLALHVEKQSVYAILDDNLLKYSLEGVETLPFAIKTKLFDFAFDFLCYMQTDDLVQIVNLKKESSTENIQLPITDKVSSISFSNSGMHIVLGFEDGRIKIFHTITTKQVLNLLLFDKTKKVSNVGFITENIIVCQSDSKLLFIDVLQKSKLADITVKEKIERFLCFENALYYTNDNRLFQINIHNLEELQVSKVAILKDRIVDVKKIPHSSSLFILTESSLHIIHKSNEIEDIDSSFDYAKKLGVFDKDKVIIGFSKSSKIISEIKSSSETDVKIEPAQKNIKFLTVDDSTTVRLVIRRAIENGFKDVEVAEAKDGVEAVEYLKKHTDTNVVILDWNMPRMNGDEVVDIVSKIPELSHIKIIMATTEGSTENVKAMISKGVKGYLVKPLKPNSVNPLVAKIIDIVKKEEAEK